MESAYILAVFFKKRFIFEERSAPPKIKKPELIKKKGTARRAIMRVNIKLPVWLKWARGEVWMAITRTAAISLKASRAG